MSKPKVSIAENGALVVTGTESEKETAEKPEDYTFCPIYGRGCMGVTCIFGYRGTDHYSGEEYIGCKWLLVCDAIIHRFDDED